MDNGPLYIYPDYLVAKNQKAIINSDSQLKGIIVDTSTDLKKFIDKEGNLEARVE